MECFSDEFVPNGFKIETCGVFVDCLCVGRSSSSIYPRSEHGEEQEQGEAGKHGHGCPDIS